MAEAKNNPEACAYFVRWLDDYSGWECSHPFSKDVTGCPCQYWKTSGRRK